MLCRIDRGKVTVWSRNEKVWTGKFANVEESVKALPLTTAILDGEIVIVDAQGQSSFQRLQRAMGKSVNSGFVYEVFDLLGQGDLYGQNRALARQRAAKLLGTRALQVSRPLGSEGFVSGLLCESKRSTGTSKTETSKMRERHESIQNHSRFIHRTSLVSVPSADGLLPNGNA